jgi:hypothetical protein
MVATDCRCDYSVASRSSHLVKQNFVLKFGRVAMATSSTFQSFA